MRSIGQENLETIMIDFFAALRRGDFEAAAELLDPEVSWQGLREEWVCHGREEVVGTFRWGLEQRREIDALEFTRGAEGSRSARFAHADVWIGGWLVEPGGRHGLLAAAAEEGDQALAAVWLPAAWLVHRCDRSRRPLRAAASAACEERDEVLVESAGVVDDVAAARQHPARFASPTGS